MPGPVSDSYDPEWGTAAHADSISAALAEAHRTIGILLGGKSPKYILEVVDMECGPTITADLTEREWRILRFACERARESI